MDLETEPVHLRQISPLDGFIHKIDLQDEVYLRVKLVLTHKYSITDHFRDVLLLSLFVGIHLAFLSLFRATSEGYGN